MKLASILLALSLLVGCGYFTHANNASASLEVGVKECVSEVLGNLGTLGTSGGGNSDALAYDWHFKAHLSEREMMDKVAALRDLLQERLTQEGARIHGRGSTGTPEALLGFDLDYTTSTEEGLVWVMSTDNGGGKRSVFVVWHGVRVD